MTLHSSFDLSGKVALVTGGSRGLGKAMARGLAEAGAGIVIASRNEAELQGAAAEIASGLAVRVEYVLTDMTNPDQVESLAAQSLERLGRVDILINNAGGNAPQAADKITDEVWDGLVELNLSSCMRLTRALIPQMKERRWGRVVYISSVMGLSGREERSAYCATKAALLGLARAGALDLGPFGITVNCIAPGPFLTDLPGRILTDAQKQEFADVTALGRWGRPDELQGIALLLASEAGSYITGTTIVVDGGAMARMF
ncbi:MAG: SDR family NAD(P)-dependent oxidoreductase [Bryobacteraceae bacterium]